MSLVGMIRSDYQEFISMHSHEYPKELIQSLKSTERAPLFLNSLAKEISIMEMRQGLKMDRMKIKTIVYDMTKTFLALLKRKADEASMSEMEKIRLLNEANSKRIISDEVAKEYQKNLEMDKVIEIKDRS